MSLINTRVVQVDLSQIVKQLERLNNNLEQVFHIDRPDLVPNVDFDPDDYSATLYSDEESELIDQHVRNRIIGR